MTDTITIPVDLDTKPARSSLAQLNRDKSKAQRRITSAARKTQRMAVRAFAFTGVSATLAKFQTDAPSGNVDIFEEALVPYYAKLQQETDRAIGFSAKARGSAREQTKAAFSYQVGRTGELVGMQQFYETVNRIQQDVESGRNLVRQDPRFLGPDLATVTQAALVGNFELFLKNLAASSPLILFGKGIGYIVEGLTAE